MKRLYFFGEGKADGDGSMKNVLGGKGAGLAEMTLLGMPVPPGFTIATSVCTELNQLALTTQVDAGGGRLPDGLDAEVRASVERIGALVGMGFGDGTRPLLLSVRSGSRASMPGMMDTVLNLGLTETTCRALARLTDNPRFAWDCYRRFVAMYGDVVMGVKAATESDPDPFDAILEQRKTERRVEHDRDLSAQDLEELVGLFKAEIRARTGQPFPDDPWAQLSAAIAAVFASWNNHRAVAYRAMYGYPSDWGTACTVQAMVFGNMGDDCATGVAFSRDPSTGDNHLYGEFLVNAQGEDVVAGTRTPRPISELRAVMPDAYARLDDARIRLEKHFRDMQDMEFTIQGGKLWMLQTRNGKRAGRAMIKVAVDLVREGLRTEEEAIQMLEAGKLDELLHPTLDPTAKKQVLTRGLPASPGAAIGKIVFTAAGAEQLAARDQASILVRTETSPEDIHGMKAAHGILTARGGYTSHAAVVARGMGKCCVVGASQIRVDYQKKQLTIAGQTYREGEVITLDGSTGDVILGQVPLVPARLDADFATVMGWVDRVRRLRVRTNADTPTDAQTARAFGAEGIGLCRTEHMFFAPDRILAVRQMILAGSVEERRKALEKILPMQRQDFEEIFRAMDGLPVTIRLLDPPLHEFLPHGQAEVDEVARDLGVPPHQVSRKRDALTEANPMLGHRGVRLGITYPEIYETQARAIAEAACAATRAGVKVIPEIMIPLVATERELAVTRALVTRVVDAIFAREQLSVPYLVGTMIELPRACVVADRIAVEADFFSFGTNDLTQTTFGFSRDDAGNFLPQYVSDGLLEEDPFQVLDAAGVGKLVEMAVERGCLTRPGLKLGICGEHGGEPKSVKLCHRMGLDYVSCSPFRVPIARVAAAQAVLETPVAGAPAAKGNQR